MEVERRLWLMEGGAVRLFRFASASDPSEQRTLAGDLGLVKSGIPTIAFRSEWGRPISRRSVRRHCARKKVSGRDSL